jgi:hypothetical protein
MLLERFVLSLLETMPLERFALSLLETMPLERFVLSLLETMLLERFVLSLLPARFALSVATHRLGAARRLIVIGAVAHHRVDARSQGARTFAELAVLAQLRRNSRIWRAVPWRARVIFRWRSQFTRSSSDHARGVN